MQIDKETLEQLYCKEYLTLTEVAYKLNCSAEYIRRRMIFFNIPRRSHGSVGGNPDYTQYDWLYNQYVVLKKSCREIAEEYGFGATTIRWWLYNLGIGVRDRSEALIGRVFTEEWKDKMSEARMGKYLGKDNNNWKGGKVLDNIRMRSSRKYKVWKRSVLERDNFQCRLCDNQYLDVHCHHIKPFTEFPDIAFEVNNGIALCSKCHRKVESKDSLFLSKMNVFLESLEVSKQK